MEENRLEKEMEIEATWHQRTMATLENVQLTDGWWDQKQKNFSALLALVCALYYIVSLSTGKQTLYCYTIMISLLREATSARREKDKGVVKRIFWLQLIHRNVCNLINFHA